MVKEDRISSLPDCLLLDIISRIKIKIIHYHNQKKEVRLLSTKEVIKKTSTVSKRWQYLWTLLPNLIFIDYYGRGLFYDQTKYLSFIDKTLTQCPTDVKLNKFKLHIRYDNEFVTILPSQVNSWIRHAISRNVQEVDLKIKDERSTSYIDNQFSYDDEQLFNNSCITIMRISNCLFNPPNNSIRWDKLTCLCISKGELDSDLVGIILSGSPCLETLELNNCDVVRRNLKSLFENFVVIRLSCEKETYKRLSYDHYDKEYISMKLLRCQFNPPNVAIRWDKLKFLCISAGKLDENLIQKILSGSPCLETLELDRCYGIRRIEVTSKRFKDLVLTNYGVGVPMEDYIDTIEINAPYMLSLTVKDNLHLEKLLLLNISSLAKADLDYLIHYRFAHTRGRTEYDIGEEMLKGLLPSLGHVNEIALGYYCLRYLSHLRDKGFQFFRVGADGEEDRSTELTASGWKKVAVTAAAETKTEEKVEETGESDDVAVTAAAKTKTEEKD